jgi:hypothetical protein
MYRNLLIAALFAITALSCKGASATPLVRMDLVDRDTGSVLPVYPYRGDAWVPGSPGHRYSVRLANQRGERVLVVLSVDGVNAVSGQTAAPGQAGYVLEPWATAEIVGWRKSQQDVAQFVFTDLDNSYAARTGRPRNVGVVGIAVFNEARPQSYSTAPPAVAGEMQRKREASGRTQAPAAQESDSDSLAGERQALGTGHGQREWSPVARTGFIRASRHPSQVTELRYDEARQLAMRGIVPQPPVAAWHRPHAFPHGFVPDP